MTPVPLRDDSAERAFTMGLPEGVTLVELLRRRAVVDGDRLACVFLDDKGVEARRITYGGLDAEAAGFATVVASRFHAGDRVVLMVPSGFDFVRAFLGCLYAGVVPVPVHPPGRSPRLARARRVVDHAQPAAIVAEPRLAARLARERAWPSIEVLRTDDGAPASRFRPVPLDAAAPAFLQYTSGSVSDPKGVVVTHANVMRNQRMIQRAFRTRRDSVVVSWLPMQHDMGLVGTLLHPLYIGCQCVLMPPVSAMVKPVVWLRAISDYRGTVSGGPNNGFDLCTDRIDDDGRRGLDLRSWQVAFNGSEPVRAASMRRFSAAFRPAGFSPTAFVPCYGLAEATLLVSAARHVVEESIPQAGAAGTARPRSVSVGTPWTTPGLSWSTGSGTLHARKDVRVRFGSPGRALRADTGEIRMRRAKSSTPCWLTGAVRS